MASADWLSEPMSSPRPRRRAGRAAATDQVSLSPSGAPSLGDLAQGDHRVLVAVAVDGQFGAAGNLARTLGGEQDEIEPVGNLVDAIFDGNARHGALRNQTATCAESAAISEGGRQRQGFPPLASC
jgi:hypothetical protein